jgi:hypothetical protein
MIEKRQPQQMLLLYVVTHLQETEIISMSMTLYQYQLKLDQGPKYQNQNSEVIQEGAGNSLELISIGKDFLNRAPAAQQLRERMDKWDLIKLKNFCTTKEMVSKLKRPTTQW